MALKGQAQGNSFPPERLRDFFGFVHLPYLLHPLRLYPIRDRLRHNVVRR